ncbi:hypothetical protein ABPG72_009801 [Tetrahymena utriculariae]
MIQQILLNFLLISILINCCTAVNQSQCCTSETWIHYPVECNGDCCPANQIKVCGEQSMCIQKGQIQRPILTLESKIHETSCDLYDELEKIYTCGELGYPLQIVSEINNAFKEQKAFVCEHLFASAFNSYQECFVYLEQNDSQISYCNNPLKDNFKIGLTYFKGGNVMDLASQLGLISCKCIQGEVEYINLIENYILNLPICSVYKFYDSKKYVQQYVGPYQNYLKDALSKEKVFKTQRNLWKMIMKKIVNFKK